MKEHMKKILECNSYSLVDLGLNLYSNDLKSEYFIFEDYSINEFLNFFEIAKTGVIIKRFNSLQGKPKFENLKKNTSLYLLIKVEELSENYELLKNQILLVEEDVYYFRKFVILYTEESVIEISDKVTNSSMYNYLEENILKFESDMFFKDSYFVVMELAIKLPFFVIKESENEYKTIEEQYEDETNDSIDKSLLDIFSESEDLVAILSDVNNESEILDQLSHIFEGGI